MPMVGGRVIMPQGNSQNGMNNRPGYPTADTSDDDDDPPPTHHHKKHPPPKPTDDDDN
jgi:hypothetical protein